MDQEGRPLLMYHGTETAGFGTFDSHATGIFFFEDEALAHEYSNSDSTEFAPPPIEWSEEEIQDRMYDADEGSGGIYSVYLRMEHPLRLDADGAEWEELEFQGEITDSDHVARWAHDAGYDSVIISNVVDRGPYGREGYEADVYVVFSGNQIKSATENTGAFSLNHNDIRR